MKNHCINCQSRTAECHASCEDYKAFRKHRDGILEKRIQENDKHMDVPHKIKRMRWREMKR